VNGGGGERGGKEERGQPPRGRGCRDKGRAFNCPYGPYGMTRPRCAGRGRGRPPGGAQDDSGWGWAMHGWVRPPRGGWGGRRGRWGATSQRTPLPPRLPWPLRTPGAAGPHPFPRHHGTVLTYTPPHPRPPAPPRRRDAAATGRAARRRPPHGGAAGGRVWAGRGSGGGPTARACAPSRPGQALGKPSGQALPPRLGPTPRLPSVVVLPGPRCPRPIPPRPSGATPCPQVLSAPDAVKRLLAVSGTRRMHPAAAGARTSWARGRRRHAWARSIGPLGWRRAGARGCTGAGLVRAGKHRARASLVRARLCGPLGPSLRRLACLSCPPDLLLGLDMPCRPSPCLPLLPTLPARPPAARRTLPS
jgi:hypothetical protein